MLEDRRQIAASRQWLRLKLACDSDTIRRLIAESGVTTRLRFACCFSIAFEQKPHKSLVDVVWRSEKVARFRDRSSGVFRHYLLFLPAARIWASRNRRQEPIGIFMAKAFAFFFKIVPNSRARLLSRVLNRRRLWSLRCEDRPKYSRHLYPINQHAHLKFSRSFTPRGYACNDRHEAAIKHRN